MPYFSRPIPELKTVDELSRWVQEELNFLTLALAESTELELRPRSAPASKPREGMIVYADGTNWNPGSGAGPYVYQAGAWLPLVVSGSVGTWTPVITFAVPGNLVVTYAAQTAQYIRLGSLVIVSFSVQTATFTFTTATGSLAISGLPFTVAAGNLHRGACVWGGFTLAAGYTDVVSTPISTTTTCSFRKSGSTKTVLDLDATDCVSGTNIDIRSSVAYQIA